MNVNIYKKGDYEDFCDFRHKKNKANSKPIEPNFKIPDRV